MSQRDSGSTSWWNFPSSTWNILHKMPDFKLYLSHSTLYLLSIFLWSISCLLGFDLAVRNQLVPIVRAVPSMASLGILSGYISISFKLQVGRLSTRGKLCACTTILWLIAFKTSAMNRYTTNMLNDACIYAHCKTLWKAWKMIKNTIWMDMSMDLW